MTDINTTLTDDTTLTENSKRLIRFHVTACLNRGRTDEIIHAQVYRNHGFWPNVTEYVDAQIAEQRAARAGVLA